MRLERTNCGRWENAPCGLFPSRRGRSFSKNDAATHAGCIRLLASAAVHQGMQAGGACLQRLVAAVAEGRVLGVLAVAQPDLLGLREGEFLRPKSSALVAAIAVRLVPAQATCTPPVVSGRKFDTDGLFVVNFGKCFHSYLNLAKSAGICKHTSTCWRAIARWMEMVAGRGEAA